MSNTLDNKSLGISFFGAVRDLNRVVNGALDAVKATLSKQGYYMTVSNLLILHVINEFGSSENDPLKLAEMGMMDKGAFNRGLEALKEKGYIVTSPSEGKVTDVRLTEQGHEVGDMISDALNISAQKLLKTKQLANLSGHATYDR